MEERLDFSLFWKEENQPKQFFKFYGVQKKEGF